MLRGKNLYWNVSASWKRASAARHSDCACGSCLPAHSFVAAAVVVAFFFYKPPLPPPPPPGPPPPPKCRVPHSWCRHVSGQAPAARSNLKKLSWFCTNCIHTDWLTGLAVFNVATTSCTPPPPQPIPPVPTSHKIQLNTMLYWKERFVCVMVDLLHFLWM